MFIKSAELIEDSDIKTLDNLYVLSKWLSMACTQTCSSPAFKFPPPTKDSKNNVFLNKEDHSNNEEQEEKEEEVVVQSSRSRSPKKKYGFTLPITLMLSDFSLSCRARHQLDSDEENEVQDTPKPNSSGVVVKSAKIFVKGKASMEMLARNTFTLKALAKKFELNEIEKPTPKKSTSSFGGRYTTGNRLPP